MKILPVLFLLTSALSAPLIRAADHSLDIRYFGTIAQSYSDNEELRPIANLRQNEGATPSGTFLVDSNLGAQIDWRPTPTLSATAMVYCEHAASQGCPKLLWAYGKWNFATDYSLRAGRFRVAPFLGSEAQEVGYLTQWARNPTGVYTLYPSDDITGLQIERADSIFANGELRTSMSAGSQSGETPILGNYKIDVASAKFRGSWSNFEAVASATHYKVKATLNASVAGLIDQAISSGYGSIAQEYNSPIAGMLYTAGAKWTSGSGRYFIQSEWGYRTSDKLFVSESYAGYLMGGIHHGPWTAYMSKGIARTIESPRETRAGAFNPGFQAMLDNAHAHHDSWILGGRYEINKNTALKFHIGEHDSSGGNDPAIFSPAGPTAPSAKYREATFAFDFLF